MSRLKKSDPDRCQNCYAAIFREWWSWDQNGYVCRACGAVTPGPPPMPRWQRTAMLIVIGIGVVVAFGFGIAWIVSVVFEALGT